MKSLLRSVAAVVAGFVVASLIMMMVEFFNGRVLHPDLGRAAEGVTDREALRSLLAAAPAGALLVVLAGWILGGLAGGWIAARIAATAGTGHGLALGLLLTLAGIASNLMVPPPAWFWPASIAVLLPATYAGARLVGVRAPG